MRHIRLSLGLFLLGCLSFLVVSCGVEGFEPNIQLNSPLGLSAVVTNISGIDGIFLSFMALNNEAYFSGYNIYMQTNSADLITKPGYVPRTPGSTLLPTISMTGVSTAQTVTWFVTNDYSTNINGVALASGTDYFFYVTAYSILYSKNSLPSKAADVVFP